MANSDFNLKLVDAVLQNVAAWDYDAAPTTANAPSGALAYNNGSLYVHGGGGSWAKLGDNAEVDRIESAMGSVIDADGNYVAHSGTSYIDGNSNVTEDLTDLDSAIAARASDISDMQGVVGVDDGDEDLGTFSGAIIADNVSVKTALQSLETEAENFRGDLQSVLGVSDEDTGFAWSAQNYLTAMAHSTVSASFAALDAQIKTNEGEIQANDGDITDIRSAVGIADGAEDLGSFSGGIISDDGTVKAGMQELETELENVRGDLQTAVGIADEAQHLGTFSGGTISDNGTVKAGMQELETELENVRGDLQNVLGVSDEDTDLGTFSGAIIADESDVKTALQALETEAENFRGDLQSVLGVADEATALAFSGTSHLNSATQVSGAFVTLDAAVGANDSDITDIRSAVGIADGAEDLGSFSGAIISDDGTVKAGMQELETELENVRGDLQNVLGVSDEAVDLGTFSGAIIADESDVKTALQALETEAENFRGDLQSVLGVADEATALAFSGTSHLNSATQVSGAFVTLDAAVGANDSDITDIRSAMGIADGAEDLGSFTGAIISADGTVKAGMQELETDLDAVQTALGVSAEAESLGSFTGAIIADDQTVKQALQALETEAENFRGDLQTAIGISDEAQHLGTFSGAVISDNGTVKDGMQELETELENVRGDLQNVLGVSDEDVDLGTFSGGIIADESDVKTALQALETEAENFRGDLQTAIGIADEAQHLGTFSGDSISDNGTVKAGMQELETALELVQAEVNGQRTKLAQSDGEFGDQNLDGSYTWTADSALAANLRPANGAMMQVYVVDGSGNYDLQIVPVRVSSAGALTITFADASPTFVCNIISAAAITEAG